MNLIEQDWEILIVLDACRYDYFKKVYRKYFKKGKLKKMESTSQYTIEWLMKTFPDEYKDIVYISSNPYLNSKIPLYFKDRKVDCRDKFFKIIDTWDWGWNQDMGTVPADKVNSDFLKNFKIYPKKRFILHYMQPHMPYVPLLLRDEDLRNKRHKKEMSFLMFKNPRIHDLLHKPIIDSITKKIAKVYYKIFPIETITDFDGIIKRYGEKNVKKFYKENLEYVLEEVKKIVNIDRKIVITADHGEMLGEHGIFGHKLGIERYKEVVEVPWLEIEKTSTKSNNIKI